MQTDVSSVTVVATGSATNFRTRVKGLVLTSSATAGAVTLRDGVGGPIKLVVNTAAAAGLENVLIPGQGVLFEAGVHVTLAGATSVTVFYG
jgi:hypothetical protein